jgi:hypothetical protein
MDKYNSQNRVAPCPPELPSGIFWYGTRRVKPVRTPKLVNQLLQLTRMEVDNAENCHSTSGLSTDIMNDPKANPPSTLFLGQMDCPQQPVPDVQDNNPLLSSTTPCQSRMSAPTSRDCEPLLD